ncbi:MAG: hypothetical protein H6918_03380 [Sphingomonadaceae bacterium]|nr:hypothetical protein [Sphingomonadaceae bacterium]
MDTLRGNFGSGDYADDHRDYDPAEDDTGREPPPSPIGQDERRMQVRAYNHWAGLLKDRNFPSIEDLDPENLPDFGPYSVVLDFTAGIEDPAIQFVGSEIARECDASDEIETLSDVPSRSLLSRITDHYMQILANQAPIGFEAEFVNQRGATILYRGILLPFSSDDDTIDFIYGVINWKEMADQKTTDELLLEIDQALEADEAAAEGHARLPDPVTDWADGPGAEAMAGDDISTFDNVEDDIDNFDNDELDLAGAEILDFDDSFDNGFGDEEEDFDDEDYENEYESGSSGGFASLANTGVPKGGAGLPEPRFGLSDLGGFDEDDEEDDWGEEEPILGAVAPRQPLVLDNPLEQPDTQELEAFHASDAGWADEAEANGQAVDAGELGLYDCLAAARELAMAARSSEDRTRVALYEAVGQAYDFSIAALDAPGEFEELVAENGLTVQDRAPMTPVVKLVFGADYDKTRLTEYAAVLNHGHRLGLARGELAGFLRQAEGGLKGVVKAERRLRREESGKPVEAVDGPREVLAKKLRKLDVTTFDALDPEGPEFGLVMIRRMSDGTIAVLGEVPEDVPLVERAARKLVG